MCTPLQDALDWQDFILSFLSSAEILPVLSGYFSQIVEKAWQRPATKLLFLDAAQNCKDTVFRLCLRRKSVGAFLILLMA